MTAITFGALVVAPATMGANDAEFSLRAASKATVLASTRAVAGATVDVGATHTPRMDTVPCSEAAPVGADGGKIAPGLAPADGVR